MIFITGDFHGDMRRFLNPALRRLKKGDYLIICGDFGFVWDGSEEETKALEKLGHKKYTILFIDGTHENFDLLDHFPTERWNGGVVHRISGNILHLMRGEIFQIDGKSFFTFGGGESEEKPFRVEAGKWWSAELPTYDEMKSGVDNLEQNNYTVDYIITHSPCPGVLRYGEKKGTHILDVYFERLEKVVKFRKWFFGSLHINRRFTARCEAVFDEILPIE